MSGRRRRGLSFGLTFPRWFLPALAICALAGPGETRLQADGPGGAGAQPTEMQALDRPVLEPLDPRVQTLSDRYREVFATLAQGDRKTAIERAATLETQALEANPGQAIGWLSQADRILLVDYVHARPECVLPLAIFYQRLLVTHAAQRRYGLTHRALQVAEGLYGQMTLAARTEDERRLTSAAYAGFAADLLTVPAPARAAEMLSRGLLLTPDDADANVALAVLLLRDRRPAAAAVRLDRVIGMHAGNREAQLRRALMRPGFSAEGRAAREIESLATGKELDWVALIAAQESARRLLASGNYDKTIAFVNRAIERFPSDSSLRVALAFAAARSNRRAEGQAAVEAALTTTAPSGESARRRYGELPIRLLRPRAVLAEEAADARTAGLAAAIAGAARAVSPATAAVPAVPATGAAPAGGSR